MCVRLHLKHSLRRHVRSCRVTKNISSTMRRYDYDISLYQFSHNPSLQWLTIHRHQSERYKGFRTATVLHSAHNCLKKRHIFWSCNVLYHLKHNWNGSSMAQHPLPNFDVLLTVHLIIFISVINQLDAQNFCFTISLFHVCTCFEHQVLIIRRWKLYYTASGIITLKQVSGLNLLKYNSINMSK